MNEPAHILVVDDHYDIRELVKRHLQKYGYRVTCAESSQAARRLLEVQNISLIVLDIMMPGEDGLSLCRYIRGHSDTPIILLTALGEEADRVLGLEMGADDYLCKPFGTRELVARIKTVLRRSNTLPATEASLNTTVKFDRWTLNSDLRELTDETRVTVPLSSAEFSMLSVFITRPKRVLSRDQLLDLTQGRESKALDRSIDNQISRLRQKIELDPKNPQLIITVWGDGYRFTSDVNNVTA